LTIPFTLPDLLDNNGGEVDVWTVTDEIIGELSEWASALRQDERVRAVANFQSFPDVEAACAGSNRSSSGPPCRIGSLLRWSCQVWIAGAKEKS